MMQEIDIPISCYISLTKTKFIQTLGLKFKSWY